MSVISDEPMIRNVSLSAINTERLTPSSVIVNTHAFTSTTSPGVQNRFNAAVNISMNIIGLRPFTMNLNGTWDIFTSIAKNNAAIIYPLNLLKQNNDIRYANVPTTFTLGSSLCITESVA